MKFDKAIPVKALAKQIGATDIIGDDTLNALGINEIHHVKKGDITFSDVQKYFDKALKSNASIIILNEKVESIPEGKAVLVHPQPFEAYDSIVRTQRPFMPLSEATRAGSINVAA